MKASFNCLVILISGLCFSYPTGAQDKTAVSQDSVHNPSHLKDSALPKKNTLKKEAAASSDSTAPTPSHFQLNTVYQSNNVYLGRSDSAVMPLITPQISYIFKSGFEIDLNVGIDLQEPCWQMNSYVLDVSYTFSPGNYTGAATLSASNYSLNSTSIQAGQNGSLEYDNNYDFSFVQASLNLSWIFATTPDYQLVFALQHEYDFFGGNLSVTPTATMNASTQNVYSSYYKNKKFKIHRPGNLPPDVSISGEVLNSGKFQIMDYELSAPLNYTAGKWTFNFTPTYALPVNPADILLTTKSNNGSHKITYKETIPNKFYYQVGITYAF
jgi:hypothetical protein